MGIEPLAVTHFVTTLLCFINRCRLISFVPPSHVDYTTVLFTALCSDMRYVHLLSRMLVGHDQVLWQKCSVDQLVTLYRVFVFNCYSVLVQHAANYFTKISFWFKIFTIVYNWQFFCRVLGNKCSDTSADRSLGQPSDDDHDADDDRNDSSCVSSDVTWGVSDISPTSDFWAEQFHSSATDTLDSE